MMHESVRFAYALKWVHFIMKVMELLRTINIMYRVACCCFSTSGFVNVVLSDILTGGDRL